MGEKWRIESIDPKAGIAFASWRTEYGREQIGQITDSPCLYFAPPDFRPEPIANPAIAFGACGGGFESGLFIADVEAAFDTPDDLGEFVRRLYVGGSSGDDGEGGEPRPGNFPGGPEGEGDGGDENGKADHCVTHMIAAVDEFRSQCEKLGFGNTELFDWKVQGGDGQTVINGALHVIDQFARLRDIERDERPDLEWEANFHMFCSCIWRIGGYDLATLIDERMDHELVLPIRYHMRWELGEVPADPMERWARIPLPEFAKHAVPPQKYGLNSLVVEFLSSPAFISPFLHKVQLLELIVFAVACGIASTPVAYRTSSRGMIATAKTENESISWLREHLPSLAFSEKYEQRIREARNY